MCGSGGKNGREAIKAAGDGGKTDLAMHRGRRNAIVVGCEGDPDETMRAIEQFLTECGLRGALSDAARAELKAMVAAYGIDTVGGD